MDWERFRSIVDQLRISGAPCRTCVGEPLLVKAPQKRPQGAEGFGKRFNFPLFSSDSCAELGSRVIAPSQLEDKFDGGLQWQQSGRKRSFAGNAGRPAVRPIATSPVGTRAGLARSIGRRAKRKARSLSICGARPRRIRTAAKRGI
jgi:hypothetical protein